MPVRGEAELYQGNTKDCREASGQRAFRESQKGTYSGFHINTAAAAIVQAD